MKKLFLALIFFVSTHVASENTLCMVDFQEKLSDNSLKKVLEMRPKATKHCLVCGTLSCKLKIWDSDNKSNEKICKRLFCKPIKTNRNVYASSENLSMGITSVSFTYGVNTKGRIDNVKLISLEGEMERKMAYKFLKDNLKTLRYEPLIIDDEIYALNGLSGMTSWDIYQR
jgi:hypothetical protein